MPEVYLKNITGAPQQLRKAYDVVCTRHPGLLPLLPVYYEDIGRCQRLHLLDSFNREHLLTVDGDEQAHYHGIIGRDGKRLDMIRVAIILDSAR